MSGKGSGLGSTNARKAHKGLTVSVSLTAEETDAIAAHLGVPYDAPEVKKYVIDHVKQEAVRLRSKKGKQS